MSTDSDILAAIADESKTRNDIAALYAAKIAAHSFDDIVAVNESIERRWSQHALVWIKKRALQYCFGDNALE